MVDVAANLGRVLEQIAAAARAAGRPPQSVQLVAVSKTKPAEMVRAAIEAGARIIGENYVQEAKGKIPIAGKGAAWHLIGHLQRNKAAEAVELFDMIETLDSTRLAKTLDRLGRERGLPIRTLIEVNTGGEATKSGVAPKDLTELIESLRSLEWVQVEGLMTVPPLQPDPEGVRPFFRTLRQIRDRLAPHAPPNVRLEELSMGMSADFPVAISEGATMVRVGRAIFGER